MFIKTLEQRGLIIQTFVITKIFLITLNVEKINKWIHEGVGLRVLYYAAGSEERVPTVTSFYRDTISYQLQQEKQMKKQSRMSRYFTLFRKLPVRSDVFNVYVKPDGIHGAMLKMEKMGPIRRPVYFTLNAAYDLCHRLEKLEQLYNEIRPLPRDGRLKYDEMVDQECTYKLDLSMNNYRQMLRITQSKPYFTRGPNHSITIPDIAEFRNQLDPIVDELCNTHQATFVEQDNGINKMIRGNRVAVVYSQMQSWPWTYSCPTEQILFDPNLIALIFDGDVLRIRDYCERTYPDLMVDTYQYMKMTMDYENLKVRWIRRGQNFRFNGFRTQDFLLKNEEHYHKWHTA